MANAPNLNLYGGLSADQYKSLVTPQDGGCFSELGLFFRRLGHAIFNFEWVTDSKLADRFYKHVLTENVSTTDAKAKEVYNLFSKSLFETNQADVVQKKLGIASPESKYTPPPLPPSAPANNEPADSNTATQAAGKPDDDSRRVNPAASPATHPNPAPNEGSTATTTSIPTTGSSAPAEDKKKEEQIPATPSHPLEGELQPSTVKPEDDADRKKDASGDHNKSDPKTADKKDDEKKPVPPSTRPSTSLFSMLFGGPSSAPVYKVPPATAVNPPVSRINLNKPTDTKFTSSVFPSGLWFIARQTPPEGFDLRTAPQPRLSRYLEGTKTAVEFTQAKAREFLEDKRKFFESLDGCIQGSKRLMFKRPYYQAWLKTNDPAGHELYEAWVAANPNYEEKLIAYGKEGTEASKAAAVQLINDMPTSGLMKLLEAEANKIKAQLNSFETLLSPHLALPKITIPRDEWEKYKYNDAFDDLLKVMYQIEDTLGITGAMKNHLLYTVYQCYGNDPIAKTALGEFNVAEATAASIRDSAEVFRAYIQPRFPLLMKNWGLAGFGTEEKAFEIMLQLVFPEYNIIERQALPLSLYDYHIKDQDFRDDLEKNATTFYRKEVDYSLPSFEAEREVNDAGGTRKYKERILVVGVFNNTGGHFVSNILDNEEQYVARDSMAPDSPSRSPADVFSSYAKFGVPQNTCLVVRIGSDDPSIPAFVPHRPNASYWKVPQQSNNNCYLAAALMRLTTFNFYYTQYRNNGFYQTNAQA